jgi:hypothetical protein
MIATAIAGAAVVGAGATMYASSEAAGATTSAANTAANEQQQALAQQEALAAPYTALGTSALPQLQSLLGLSGAGGTVAPTTTTGANGQVTNASGQPTSNNTLAALQNTPGYQFTLGQGLQGVSSQAAAGGMQNAVNTGQAAAAGQAANVGQAATNEGNIAVNQGNTLASIDANTAASLTSAAGNAANAYTLNNTLAGLEQPGNGLNLGGAASSVYSLPAGYNPVTGQFPATTP